MSKVRVEIALDEDLLRQLEEQGSRPGKDLDQVIEGILRESLEGKSAADVLSEVEARSMYLPEQNVAVAQAQSAALALEREALRYS